jgi:hypothetical protein
MVGAGGGGGGGGVRVGSHHPTSPHGGEMGKGIGGGGYGKAVGCVVRGGEGNGEGMKRKYGYGYEGELEEAYAVKASYSSRSFLPTTRGTIMGYVCQRN